MATPASTSSTTSFTQTSSSSSASAVVSGAMAPVASPIDHSTLTTGAKAGIGVGSVLGVACIAFLILVLSFTIRKRRRQQKSPPPMDQPDMIEKKGDVIQDTGLHEMGTQQEDVYHEIDGRGADYARELG